MKKTFKRILAVLCAAALTTLSVAIAGNFGSLKAAAEDTSFDGITFGGDSAYLKMKKPLYSTPDSVEAEVKMSSNIKDEWTLIDTTKVGDEKNGVFEKNVDLISAKIESAAANSPEVGTNYIKFDAKANGVFSVIGIIETPIDVSRFDSSELALDFWFYRSDGGVKLFDSGWIAFGNIYSKDFNPSAKGNAAFVKTAESVTSSLTPGWNHVTIPFSEFVKSNTVNGLSPDDFDFSNIRSFKFHGVTVNNDAEIGISDVKLVTIKKNINEWTLRDGGKGIQWGGFNGIVTDYTSVESDEPGAGYTFAEFDPQNKTFSTPGRDGLNIDISDHNLADLSLEFWCYSQNAGYLFKNGMIIISNDTDRKQILYYTGNKINVVEGWNYISLSLDKFTNAGETDNAYKPFDSKQAIKSFVFSACNNDLNTSNLTRIGEVKLVAKTQDKVYTSNIDESAYKNGYSILSNLNSGTDDTPYALFVTREGKPAFIYSDKMFVLNHNVCTGDFVKIGVTVNDGGTVTFNVGNDLTATSVGTADTSAGVKFTAPHSIGADAVGGMLMNGSIKNLKIVNGETASTWALSANKAYPLNAVKDTNGTNNAYFAGIENINAPVVVKYASATAGTAPTDADKMDGYVFAGWFTDEDCTKALTSTATAYAKFVDRAVLTVKAQVKNDADTSDKTDMRFVTTVDSANYKAVGFKIQIDDKTTERNLTKVYKKLLAVDSNNTIELSPADISSVSQYFAAFTVKDIPKANYDTDFNVTAYWDTLDGTRVYADTFVKSVSLGIS